MKQLALDFGAFEGPLAEDEAYLTRQLITYLGNKRSLLPFIGLGLEDIKKRLGKSALRIFDVFSGSGIAARYFKRFASALYVNDIERYAEVINRCYLANIGEVDIDELRLVHLGITKQLEEGNLKAGIVTALYSPKDDENIMRGERVFFTSRNARYIDSARQAIEQCDKRLSSYFLAPLLSEASIHANTSGVFKGFYKNRDTGIGEFGGRNGDALLRIKGDIHIPFPVFSNFECEVGIFAGDSNHIADDVPEVDVAYLDPPYNQHPYGSNYFMLNLIVENSPPVSISEISGIPDNWNRSAYNNARSSAVALAELIEKIKAKFLLISFNSEGFISLERMTTLLERIGKVNVLETKYNTFRGSRNLGRRGIHLKEYLYLVEKH